MSFEKIIYYHYYVSTIYVTITWALHSKPKLFLLDLLQDITINHILFMEDRKLFTRDIDSHGELFNETKTFLSK